MIVRQEAKECDRERETGTETENVVKGCAAIKLARLIHSAFIRRYTDTCCSDTLTAKHYERLLSLVVF